MAELGKPPGMIPGIIKGHPAVHPDGTMKGSWCLDLQKSLTREYMTELFQKKLYAGWYATDEMVERHQWRQSVSLEVQCRILPEFGFEGNRKGVFASGVSCCSSLDIACGPYAQEIPRYTAFMSWLVNPDMQEMGLDPGVAINNWSYAPESLLKEGDGPKEAYEVCQTRPGDDEVIFCIGRCQGVLAGAHQATYKDVCPDITHQDWFRVLGVDQSTEDVLDRGVIIYHAKSCSTGRIAGYISCTCHYGADAGAESYATVNNIIVLPQHRGRGVGTQLFNELLAHLEQACPSVMGDLRISVARRNSRAMEWYQRLGFAEFDDWTAIIGSYKVEFAKMQRKLDASDFDDLFAT